jgi:hypothetical protein
MAVEPLDALSFGLQVLGLGKADKAQRRERRFREAVQRERRAAKKAAIKAIKKAYREADEDSSRAMKEALKSGETSLYKTVGGTASANFARGMFRQYGIQQRQARREEAKALADIEGRSTLETNDFAGLAAGEGALAEMRSNLIKSGIDLFKQAGEGKSSSSPNEQLPPGVGQDALPMPPGPGPGPGPGSPAPRQGLSFSEALTRGANLTLTEAKAFLGGPFSSLSGFGLFDRIGSGFKSMFSNIFNGNYYTGYGGQTYYSDPVAMQSRPVNSNVFPG